jgi:two-component system C4-dicarboxylate transport sensor histidine kinase DctB
MQNSNAKPSVFLFRSWWARIVFLAVIVGMASSVWVSNRWLTARFTETISTRAELRLVNYAGTILSELRRHSIVPLLLSRDPVLIRSLQNQDFINTSDYLETSVEEIGAASLMLLDAQGRIVAATDPQQLGEIRSDDSFFAETIVSGNTVFSSNESDTGQFDFTFARQIKANNELLGVILVEVNLAEFMQQWRGANEAIFVTNTQGRIILSTEPRWLGLVEPDAMAVEPARDAIRRGVEGTNSWTFGGGNTLFAGSDTLRFAERISFRRWNIVSYTAFDSVREQVNAVLALQVMGFALILAGVFYLLSRRARAESLYLARESSELRVLNTQLQYEITRRRRVEKTLQHAEQNLQQSQKLAALGEMSAAVSHELNQPLAAMKTYLAGAQLLIERNRTPEALSSFQRINDLIDRMGAITQQLKSYARKGDGQTALIDLRDALNAALAIVETNIKSQDVEIIQTVPQHPVHVRADRLRLEQVIINLLRNALDAMKDSPTKRLKLLIASGHDALLSVADSGSGIQDLDNLFEPFYTTKKPGDGLGLGLAISSSIISDLQGRLSARNRQEGGAVFEIRLPLGGAQTSPDSDKDT